MKFATVTIENVKFQMGWEPGQQPVASILRDFECLTYSSDDIFLREPNTNLTMYPEIADARRLDAFNGRQVVWSIETDGILAIGTGLVVKNWPCDSRTREVVITLYDMVITDKRKELVA